MYTKYAEETLFDRRIDKKIIETALLNPDEIVHGKSNRRICHKLIGDKLLRIIFEVGEKAYIVVTAYYTKPSRYIGK